MIFIKANTIYEVSLEDASIYKIEILKSDISIYIQLYNAKRVKIIFLNYYGIIDYHAICQEIGKFSYFTEYSKKLKISVDKWKNLC